jgi:hypothetical protein
MPARPAACEGGHGVEERLNSNELISWPSLKIDRDKKTFYQFLN